jgi:hypothetical protein
LSGTVNELTRFRCTAFSEAAGMTGLIESQEVINRFLLMLPAEVLSQLVPHLKLVK